MAETPEIRPPPGIAGPGALADILIASREAARASPESQFGDISDAGLRQLVDLAYHAGIAQEEGRFPRFRIFASTPLSPARTQVSPRFVPARPLRLNLFVKLAPAISHDRHALHVYEDRRTGELLTDGVLSLTDLGMNRLAQALPGTSALDLHSPIAGLQIVVLDPGHMLAGEPMPNWELKDARITRLTSVGAIKPVSDWYRRLAQELIAQGPASEEEAPASKTPESAQGLARWLAGRWSDLLGMIVHERHGGMLLVLPDSSLEGISLPHLSTDLRFGEVLRSFWRSSRSFWDVMHMGESAAPNLLRWNRSRERLFDTLFAITALSRVDGSVVFDPLLTLLGFGGRLPLVTATGTKSLVTVGNPATLEVERRAPLHEFELGTRHSAAYNICRQRPGALAFVVSQDGDLRIFASHEGDVWLWKTHWRHFL